MSIDFSAALKDKPVETTDQAPVVVDSFDPAPLIAKFDQFRVQIATMVERSKNHDVVDGESNTVAVTMTTQAKRLSEIIEKKRVELKEPYFKIIRILDGETKTLKDGLATVHTILNDKIRPYLQEQERIRQEAEKKAREEAQKEQRRLEEIARAKAKEEARIKYEAEREERERLQKIQQQQANAKEKERLRLAAIEEEKQLKEESDRKAKEEAEKAVALTPEIVSVMPEEIKTITDSGTADLKKSWAWEITDFSKLPVEVFNQRKEQIVKAMAPYFNAQIKAGIRRIDGVRIFEQVTLNTRAK